MSDVDKLHEFINKGDNVKKSKPQQHGIYGNVFLEIHYILTCFSSCRTKTTDPLIEEFSYEENDIYCTYLVKYKILNKFIHIC